MSIDHRKVAGDKAAAAGLQNTYIKQHGKKQDCLEYLDNDTWAAAWGEPKPVKQKSAQVEVTPDDDRVSENQYSLFQSTVTSTALADDTTKPVKEPLPVIETLPEPVNPPLPVTESKIKYKNVLPNGRNKKSMPAFDQWHCRIFPKDVTYPAWRSLTKTATDVANICKAKFDHAANKQQKDSNGKPVFDFTVSEAENFFKLTRPTFTKAIGLLLEIGFIEYVRPGGMVNGSGIKALYSLSEKWKSWTAPKRDNSNIIKARSSRKQNPCKGALTSIGKGALTGQRVNVTNTGKGALNGNAYFPV